MTKSLLELVNNGLDTTYTDFANTLVTSCKAIATQSALPQGYAFEGAKYFDGKILKVFTHGSWQNSLDFSKVNLADVIGLPPITSDINNANDLNSLPTLAVVKNKIKPNIHYYEPIGGGHTSLAWNTAQELNEGEDYTIGAKTGKVNSKQQTLIYYDDYQITIKGITVIAPSLANTRILIKYREWLPDGFIMVGAPKLQVIGVQGAADVGLSICSDWGQQDSLSGFYIWINDPDGRGQAWTSNPANSYSEHMYQIGWEVTYINRAKATVYPHP